MGPKEFAAACRDERDAMLTSYADASAGTAVEVHLASADLNERQRKCVLAAIDVALTDAFYTLMLALDGSASLGERQQSFFLTDDSGSVIANGDGRLEAAAWDTLQSNR